MRIIPYLTFNGNCKQAFALYKEVLGGDLFSMSFAEAPEETGMPKDPNLIMHTCLTVGAFSLMASDSPTGPTVSQAARRVGFPQRRQRGGGRAAV